MMKNIGQKKENIRKILQDLLETEVDGSSIKEDVALGLINKAKNGDVRAFEIIMKFIGEYPTEYKMTKTDEEIKNDSFQSFGL